MAQTSVAQLATDLKMPADALLEQLQKAGVAKSKAGDLLTEQDKSKLLEYLRRSHGDAESKTKITLTRKETTEIRSQDSHGKQRTVQVEVRKKRVLVKRDIAELRAGVQESPVVPPAKPVEVPVEAAEPALVEAPPVVEVAPVPEVVAVAPVSEVAAEAAPQESAETQVVEVKVPEVAAASEPPVEEKKPVVEEKAKAEPEAKPEAASEHKPGVKKVVTRASIIGEEQQRLRAEEERRKAELRARQEAEFIEKQRRAAELIRLKAEAEEKAVAARAAEAAKQVAAKTASDKPSEDKTLHKPVAKAAAGDKKSADKKGAQWKNEGVNKRQGLKTRGATGATGWRDNKHGKRSNRNNDAEEQHAFQVPTEAVVHDVHVPETISVSDLAHKMAVKATEVIKTLMKMGSMVTINQVLDQETAMIIVEEMGHKALAAKLDDPDAFINDDTAHEDAVQEHRAPVVTVMGHVDHGKTSLLDYIRRTRVASGEAGGITQHIGAYHVETARGMVTFLDTPGHEAFTAMRARGAQATDIAILVVAADDSVMPQTIEAINHAKAANVPIIVAINKMDKPEADPERVKTDLTKYGIVCEDWGGDTIMCPVSAKTGEGVDELLEMILLQADTMELRANPNRLGRGVIIEAKLDKARGPLATVLMQNGTLHVGDNIIAGLASGRVRALINDRGEKVKEAGPSTPVEIMGFDEVPSAGDEMQAVGDDRLSRQVAEERKAKVKASREATMAKVSLENMFSNMESGKQTTLNLIIKADVQGSVEAVKQAMEKLSSDEVKVHVLHSAAGAITKDDVNLASAFNAIIIGFNIRPDASAREAAEREKVDVRLYTVIYKAIEDMELAMKGLLAPEYREVLLGHAEVRNVFKITGAGVIAGCYVTDGKVQRNAQVRLLRDNVVVFEGKLSSLKHYKEDVKEMAAGFECGMSLEGHNDIKEGDVVECFIMEEIPR